MSIKEMSLIEYPCISTANNSNKREGYEKGANAILKRIERAISAEEYDKENEIAGLVNHTYLEFAYRQTINVINELKGKED